jgi:DNA adenine methylase
MKKDINMIEVRPFLKWAGGKSKMISVINSNLPVDFERYDTYIEPFIGGGAILFWILKTFPNIRRGVINDINKDLTDAYLTIKNSVIELIYELEIIQEKYLISNNKSNFYYSIREEFNKRNNNMITQTSYLIFLNKTCFNGLFRVNSKNQFNVPFGRYKNPNICDNENILNVHEILQRVTILNGDYVKTFELINDKTLYYFDPPYKPISKTSSFNSYSNVKFDDSEQIRLKEFCDRLNISGIKWMLSNSDVSVYEDNDFFIKLYENYNIDKVLMSRNINSNDEKRGLISELFIKNF